MTTELTNWNLPDSQLCLESKTEQSVAKAQTYMGGHRREKYVCLVGGGAIQHTFLMGKTIWVDKKNLLGGRVDCTYFVDREINWGGDTAQH